MLPPWQPKLRVREGAHPKFYFFDCGVVRGIIERAGIALSEDERGPLLETHILHELRSYIEAKRLRAHISYFRTPAGVEIDFIVSDGNKAPIAIEVKASERWRSDYTRALVTLSGETKLRGAYVVYLGSAEHRNGKVLGLPCETFLHKLHAGELF
jgi:predicted AAA+ superfamily ATPase